MNVGKTIVMTFDDAVSNHATLVGPLLKGHGFGATFYVCEFPPDFETNKQQYMTWEQIRALDAAGFEIGSHPLTHPNLLEIDAVAQAATRVIQVLMFHGIPDYTHPWVNTPPRLFEEYVAYLAENNFHVISMRDLLPGLLPIS